MNLAEWCRDHAGEVFEVHNGYMVRVLAPRHSRTPVALRYEVVPIEVAAYTPNVAPGAYEAVCTAVEDRQAKDGQTFRRWEFTLTDGTGKSISAASSLSTSPKSKGGKWLAALIGRTPAAGESVEPVGQHCTIIVELNENGYETVTAVIQATHTLPGRKPVAESVASSESAPAQDTPPAPVSDELPF